MTAPSRTTRPSTTSRTRGGRVVPALAGIVGCLSGLVPALVMLAG